MSLLLLFYQLLASPLPTPEILLVVLTSGYEFFFSKLKRISVLTFFYLFNKLPLHRPAAPLPPLLLFFEVPLKATLIVKLD
jgi:hypothetical protein